MHAPSAERGPGKRNRPFIYYFSCRESQESGNDARPASSDGTRIIPAMKRHLALHYYSLASAAAALLAAATQVAEVAAFTQDTAHTSSAPRPPPPSTVLLLDVYNILGHTAFGLPASALISRAAAWRDGRDGSEPIAAVIDHGSTRCAHRGGPLADRVGVLFAGPTLTADDVIVSLAKERCLGGDDDNGAYHNTTVVVTADANLINRCQRQKREGSGGASKSDLVFVEPASFLRELEKHAYADNDLFSGLSFDYPESVAGNIYLKADEEATSGKDGADDDVDYIAATQAGGDDDSESTAAVQSIERNKEDKAEDIIDTFMKETAVERTLHARSRLVRDFNAKTKRKNGRNKSGGRNRMSNRQRNKLIAKQRRSRNHSDNKIAQTARKDQAEKLRENLLAAGAEEANEAPVRTLLSWLAIPMDVADTGFDESSRPADASSTLLRWSAGSDNNGKDPLSALLHVPRRQTGPVAPETSRPLRAVVISDTHGFEAALAKMPNPEAVIPDVDVETGENAHYLLPDADVLIHCGDFAANGSRMRQRESIRKLDGFFAHQKHIKHKIVVRGNHDPDTPGRVLFKKSKALYATAPLGLKIDGVKFALQPFSRRAHTTISQTLQNLANADVLISHEPPKGVLDLTYSGMRVGSQVLRHAVEMSKTKPRCWLCGHIHEGRGASREIFAPNGERCDETTLVVNAANANVGKAHRLISGAVLLDIERESAPNDKSDATASFDYIMEKMPVDTTDLGLKAATVRPGVRRRKGVRSLRSK